MDRSTINPWESRASVPRGIMKLSDLQYPGQPRPAVTGDVQRVRRLIWSNRHINQRSYSTCHLPLKTFKRFVPSGYLAF